MPIKLTEAQAKKRERIPRHLRGMYDKAVTGSTRDALRYHCLECVAWVASEVELCTAPGCVCYPYRMTGVHPTRSAAASERALATGAGTHLPPRTSAPD